MATFDHGYALLIGVGTHHNPAYSLPFAANDAHALQRILSDPRWCAYPAAHIQLLCDEAATTAAVLDGFVWLATCAHRDPQATIVIYYSGHIGRNEETDTYCLLPYDETAATSRLSTTTLRAALNAIPSKRLLVLLDYCHAGDMTKDGPGQDSQWMITATSASMLATLQQGAGSVVLSSSTGKQRSYIQPDTSLSLFTTHLLTAFQGAGNQPGSTEVGVTHLIQYVNQQVQHAAQAINVQQTSFFHAASEDFVVSLISGGAGLGKGGWEALQQDAHAAIAAASPPSSPPTIIDSNMAIGNWVGGNLTQTKQSGSLNIEGATIGRIGTLTGGDREHLDTATSMNNLAGGLERQGHYRSAQELYERALAIYEAVLGPEHPDTATSMNNLAGLLDKMGDYVAAQPLYERALTIRQTTLGMNHPDTIKSFYKLAIFREKSNARSTRDSIQQLKAEGFWWSHHICSIPRMLAHTFQGAPNIENFFTENIAHMEQYIVDLEILSDTSIDESYITILGRYPSTTVRSIAAEVSIQGKQLQVIIDDPLLFLDPNQDYVDENIPSFEGKVTLFAIYYPIAITETIVIL